MQSCKLNTPCSQYCLPEERIGWGHAASPGAAGLGLGWLDDSVRGSGELSGYALSCALCSCELTCVLCEFVREWLEYSFHELRMGVCVPLLRSDRHLYAVSLLFRRLYMIRSQRPLQHELHVSSYVSAFLADTHMQHAPPG